MSGIQFEKIVYLGSEMIGPELDSILLDNLTEKNIYMERGKCCILDFLSTGRNEGIGEETVMILLLS